MLLLDTCALIWLAVDQSQLSKNAIHQLAANPGSLFVSAISAFEIAIKHRQHKIELPMPAMDWFTEIVEYHGIRELPVTSSIAILSVQLPPLHNDPCDRIIIATAEMNALGVITCDGLIAQYDLARVIW